MGDRGITQRCYVCDAYYEDKVKLGLHIALCYSQAVQSGRTDLPQPAELLNDEKRYTQFMRDKRHLDEEMAEARRQKVSFATREDFSAMRAQVQPNQPTRSVASASPTAKPRAVAVNGPRDESRISGAGHARPSDHLRVNAQVVSTTAAEDLHTSPAYRFKRPSSGAESGGYVASPGSPQRAGPPRAPHHAPAMDGNRAFAPAPGGQPAPAGHNPSGHAAAGYAPPPSQYRPAPQQAPAPSGERVSSGVTMLRTELQSELANVRHFLDEEKRKAAARDGAAYAPPPPPQHHQHYHQPAPSYYHAQPPPAPAPQYHSQAPSAMSPARPSSSASSSPDSPDQRLCPNCGKTFGKRGFVVHSARCGKHATEDFTFSKDAQHPDHKVTDKPTNVDPAHPHVGDGGGGGGGGDRNGMTEAEWQQFMVTYPRPVIDEQPKSAAQRAAMAHAAAQRREMMMHAGGPAPGAEPRDPCGRCGRMFLRSRVRQHEAVCVADPRM